MKTDPSIQVHDQTALDYDRLASEYGYNFPDALFGLCFEYLQPGQRILDTGIGTGLSALPFSRAGLEVYGLDGSAEMLNICRKKNIAVQLKEWDLRTVPWPYPDRFFNHVVACGLFHFFPDLDPAFREAARLVKPQGIFAFTIKAPEPDSKSGIDQKFITTTIDGVQIFSHYESYIHELIAGTGFKISKALKFLQSRGIQGQYDTYTAFVCRRLSAADEHA